MTNITNTGVREPILFFGRRSRDLSQVSTPFEAHGSGKPGFADLFKERRHICLYLRRLGVREADLEDMAQEVFLCAYRQLDSFDPSRPARPWLLGFALRVAADYRRLARHRREFIGLSSVPQQEHQGGASAEDELIWAEKWLRVDSALDKLSPEKGTVLRLYGLEDQPMSAIAARLCIPLHTAYSRLRHGRHELQRALRAVQEPRDGGPPRRR